MRKGKKELKVHLYPTFVLIPYLVEAKISNHKVDTSSACAFGTIPGRGLYIKR